MANGDIGAPALGIGAQNEATAGDSFPSRSWVSELGRQSRGQRTERRLVERARMVLSTLGRSIYAASPRLGGSRNTVRKWRDRVALARQHHPERPVEQTLRDADRSGRRPEFSEAQLIALMSLATADPQTVGEPTSHFSCADLARLAVEQGHFPHLSQSHVQRLLCRYNLKPHRHKMWLNRPNDPEYDERAATVTDLLCASSDAAQAAREKELCEKGHSERRVSSEPAALPHIVVSFDEKCGIQALERTAPERPMQPRSPAQLEHEYRRHGTLTLLSMMNMHTGFIVCGEPRPDEKTLNTRYKRRAWLETPTRRLRFQCTPRHASWLNPIEK